MRAVRAPENAFLQAAGEFQALARAGLTGSVVSLVGTLVLLLAVGPDRVAVRHPRGRGRDDVPRPGTDARNGGAPMVEVPMAEVIVAIPTFRRPQSLTRLLDALAKLETSAVVTVLVADNDAETP